MITETLERLRKLSPHAFSGDNRNAAEYLRQRREGMRAVDAWRYATAARDARSFEWLWSSETSYRTSFCNDSPLAVYERESHSGSFRVELAFIADPDGGSWRGEDDSAQNPADLWRYFREERKFGKTAARDAVAEAMERDAELERGRQRGDYEFIGVVCRVFWRVPKLEAGEPIAEDSCWGFETSDATGFDGWNFARDIAQAAISQAAKSVCRQHRLEQSWRKAFGFILPAEPMGAV